MLRKTILFIFLVMPINAFSGGGDSSGGFGNAALLTELAEKNNFDLVFEDKNVIPEFKIEEGQYKDILSAELVNKIKVSLGDRQVTLDRFKMDSKSITFLNHLGTKAVLKQAVYPELPSDISDIILLDDMVELNIPN